MRGGLRIESVCALLVLALAGLVIRGIWSDGRDFARLHAYLRQLQAPPPVAVPVAHPASEAAPAPAPLPPEPAEPLAPTAAVVQAPLVPIAFTDPPATPTPHPAQPMRYIALSQMSHDPSTWRFQITTTNGQSRIIKIGQAVDGWKLTTGSSRAVVLEKNGTRIRLAKEECADSPTASLSRPQ